ncbi:hypothetical protein SAMN00768000_3508 [Sulfobacillus thermosulfidooxidans DSM 9293]|uniref:Uncharacterized protein n=1 Tax=Sulfobacillus thermosulfidooxidans (strain DSM 9293 / VKM B-1269 / AT-1) TaxID=929705 RepID=A0A1W1WNV3_SULTA|nr:hypothetical protein SAMN00768000_3508 [Sulfobacillus thermosulfidooxidans DSM 9293]
MKTQRKEASLTLWGSKICLDNGVHLNLYKAFYSPIETTLQMLTTIYTLLDNLRATSTLFFMTLSSASVRENGSFGISGSFRAMSARFLFCECFH